MDRLDDLRHQPWSAPGLTPGVDRRADDRAGRRAGLAGAAAAPTMRAPAHADDAPAAVRAHAAPHAARRRAVRAVRRRVARPRRCRSWPKPPRSSSSSPRVFSWPQWRAEQRVVRGLAHDAGRSRSSPALRSPGCSSRCSSCACPDPCRTGRLTTHGRPELSRQCAGRAGRPLADRLRARRDAGRASSSACCRVCRPRSASRSSPRSR